MEKKTGIMLLFSLLLFLMLQGAGIVHAEMPLPKYYRVIKIYSPVNLTDYTLVIWFDDTNFDFSGLATSDASDVYFTLPDGRPVYYFVDYYSPSTYGMVVFVKMNLTQGYNYLVMWYGGANRYPDYRGATKVFSYYTTSIPSLPKYSISTGKAVAVKFRFNQTVDVWSGLWIRADVEGSLADIYLRGNPSQDKINHTHINYVTSNIEYQKTIYTGIAVTSTWYFFELGGKTNVTARVFGKKPYFPTFNVVDDSGRRFSSTTYDFMDIVNNTNMIIDYIYIRTFNEVFEKNYNFTITQAYTVTLSYGERFQLKEPGYTLFLNHTDTGLTVTRRHEPEKYVAPLTFIGFENFTLVIIKDNYIIENTTITEYEKEVYVPLELVVEIYITGDKGIMIFMRELVFYTVPPGTFTPVVIYPYAKPANYSHLSPPSSLISDVNNATVGGIISTGILLGVAVAMIRMREPLPHALAAASAFLLMLGLIFGNYGIISVAATVFVLSLSFILAMRLRI